MVFITQINYGTILRSLLKLQHLSKIICLLISFSWAEAADTNVLTTSSTSDTERYSAMKYSTAGVTNQIPLSNGKYQITFVFKHFSQSSFATPLSIKAENQLVIDDLRKYVPGQIDKSFCLIREAYVSDGHLNIEYGSATASVFLTMFIKEASTTGSTPPPPPPSSPSSPSAGNLPWLEDFNASTFKGSLETQNLYTHAIFKVQDGKLLARGVGQAAWKSEIIKLNGNTVNFSMVLSSLGSLESAYDHVKVYYRLDNGSERLAGEAKGNIAASKTIAITGVQGNTLQLIVRIRNSDISEHYLLDNVKVALAASTTPSAGGLPWLEDFNASTFKGSIETANIYKHGSFKVENGKLVARGVGQVAWKSEVIKLGGKTVDFSMKLSSKGNLESNDGIQVYYRLDNGSERLAGEAKGNIAASKTIAITAVKGNTLQLIVRIKNSDISEHYLLDNVHVKLTSTGTHNEQSIPPVTAEIYRINFNADNAAAISGWNHFNTTPTAGKKISLKNSKNESSPVSVTLETSWNDHNNKGYNSGSNSGLYPDAVMKTQFCTDSQERISISGLDNKKKYQFTFFASSMYDGDRTTEFLIGTQKITLNAARNKNLTATLKDVSPDSQGKVVLEVRKASGAYRGFLNTLIIQTSESTNAKINSTLAKAKGSEETDSEVLEGKLPASFKIYPNPVSDKLYIETQEEGQYNLYNTQGSIVKKGTVRHDIAEYITVSGLQHGTYYLRFVTQKGTFTEKIIIHP